MTVRLLAEFDAMTRVAADQRQSRNTLIRIQKARREAVLDPDALGKILPAREVVQAFRAVNLATREGIWSVTQRCEVLSDTVRVIRNDFRDIDAEISARFEHLLGGA
ncbi:MAG: hypothetical protein ABIR39_08495 [Nocardioides sp.]|uniref:hypothetical protein n=1 Tax=Nocardioides sp. TaxID=35761 RepID=UPI00326617E0